eukprot:CAMPEP_0194388098 /NCGR_PEP_ID=MMETSP0174-20130528/96464_1 /TAXON_ID=216777 /ORGANISM="Proboscia alata, Strain PI-D3" /LENGTH=56 /DNA_ID=CAMNT_0039179019 /DNA_START=9 /DNA_END=176 /DNA_ORIENTATION=+
MAQGMPSDDGYRETVCQLPTMEIKLTNTSNTALHDISANDMTDYEIINKVDLMNKY